MSKPVTKAATEVMIDLILKGDSFEWSEVMEAVKASGVKVKNWMFVRSVLQAYIDGEFITRDTSDLNVERYIVTYTGK